MTTQQDNNTRELIERAIMEFSPKVSLNPKTTFDDVRTIIRVFMRQHPEIFWFSHQYLYDEKTDILKFRYNFSKEKADFFKGEIGKVINDDFQIDYVKTLSELERVVYVYKWIANRTTYNEYSSFNQTIYSVLINRNSVCTGYAKTAQYLLGLVGVESQLVFGKFHSDKSEHGRHGWNIVKINGEWYHIDFCLADPTLGYLLNGEDNPIEEDSMLWNYFGVTTETILQNRSIEVIETLPLCGNRLSDIPEVKVLKPQKQLISCKSDSGTSAKVYLDSFSKDKVIKVSRNGTSDLLQNEARLLSLLSDSPHIIKSFGLNDRGLELEQLTPWSELLNSHYYNPTEYDLRNILRQLIEGLIECRNKGIMYSDIHYNNVFVTQKGVYKWGDFGIAFPLQPDDKLTSKMIGEDGKPKGSYWFMAPETYHKKVFTEASAIYSVAMMAYFVMNDMRPPLWIGEEHQQEALIQRLNGKDLPAPVFVDKYNGLWTLIHVVLSHSMESRPCGFEDFISLLDSNVGVTEDNCPTIETDFYQSPIIDNDSMPLLDVDGCIDEYFVKKCIYKNAYSLCIDDSDIDDSDTFGSTMGRRWGDGGIHDTDSFACTCGVNDWNEKPSSKDDFAKARIANINPVSHRGDGSCPPTSPAPSPCSIEESSPNRISERETYGVDYSKPTEKRSFWSKLFGKKEKTEIVNASAYAPAEINPHKYFIVRIFIHRSEESSNIDQTVKDVDKSAVKKANKPLDIPVKNGDKITIQLSMSDGINIDETIQNFVWSGHYIECDFGCEVTNKNLYSVLGKAIVAINNVPCGDLKFTIDVVPTESSKVYAPVETHRYSKIFISYAHADYSQVRGIAEGCKMNGSDYFFDRHSLQAGDIFKDKILQYIDNADLFVLCWSKNAAESEWVQIERKHALELIDRGNHQLAIYPLSMPPEAPLPADMSDKYNFATL